MPPLVVVVGAAVLASVIHWVLPDAGGPEGGEDPPVLTRRLARIVEGIVVSKGMPVGGAAVRLFEDLPGGFEGSTRTTADGAFELLWQPTATLDRRNLFVEAEMHDGSRGSVIVAAREGPLRIVLPEWTRSEGVVVDAAGRPVDGAIVWANIPHSSRPERIEATAGGFRTQRFASGAALDLVFSTPGGALQRERRFKAGEFLLLRARPGRDVEVRVCDPDGAPVRSAVAWPGLPRTFRALVGSGKADDDGLIRILAASRGGDCLVRVEAPGFLPARVVAAPHQPTPVVLWPSREVVASVFDEMDRGGVEPVRFEITPKPPEGSADWWGEIGGMVRREYPVRPGKVRGRYRLTLPTCPLDVRLAAPDRADAERALPPSRKELSVGMWKLPSPPHATLEVRAQGAPGGFTIVVVDLEDEAVALERIHGERATLQVPFGVELQIASPQAYKGYWLPVAKIQPLNEGQTRTQELVLRPALALDVVVKPAVEGEVQLVDVVHRKLAPPQKAKLESGWAKLWMRPHREVRVSVSTPDNYFAHQGEFRAGEVGQSWEVRLRPAAGLAYRVRDRGGHPVPFALTRIWEPRTNGHMNLRGEPRVFRADASGHVRAFGLRGGEAAVEIRAAGLRTRRFAPVRIEEGKLPAGGEVVLEPPTYLSGRVVDPESKPVSGVWARVLEPGVRRLALPGGAEVDLYDLQAFSTGPAISDSRGEFEIADTAPRDPILALYPSDRTDLAALAVEAPEPGADVVLPRLAYIELDVPGGVEGVYALLGRRRAVLIKNDPPMSLRPLPVVVPAGRVELFIRLRDRRWAAPIVELAPEQNLKLSPRWRR